MAIGLKAYNWKTVETVALGVYDTEAEAEYAIDYEIEWDEDDNPDEWEFILEELNDLT